MSLNQDKKPAIFTQCKTTDVVDAAVAMADSVTGLVTEARHFSIACSRWLLAQESEWRQYSSSL